MLISNFEELLAALGAEPELQGYELVPVADGIVEARRGADGLTFADTGRFTDPAQLLPYVAEVKERGSRLMAVGGQEALRFVEALDAQLEVAPLAVPITSSRLSSLLRDQLELIALRRRVTERGRWIDRYRYELGELIGIARAVSAERDVVRKLGIILEKSRYVTHADAGSVYIVEPGPPRVLHFMVSQNDSVAIDFREFTLPIDDQSIVGAAVISRSNINIADLTMLDQPGNNPWGFHHHKGMDQKTGYRTRSLLTVPMVNQKDDVIGVIQLINKKLEPHAKLVSDEDFDQVIPFDKRSEELCQTLASQAAVSLENAMLYQDIRKLFEGFVKASVTAIESRDPTTSGHSTRVAQLTCGLAASVDQLLDGPYRDVRFTREEMTQIEYAALLHDFGKVGVREKVLVKAKKLYESEREVLLSRFDYIRKSVEAERLRHFFARSGGRPDAAEVAVLEQELAGEMERLDDIIKLVLKANEPTVLAQGSFERLAEIASHTYLDAQGERRPYLTPAEINALRIPRGSLTEDERVEIESHVVHTYNFLKTIPWGRTFHRIPEIAGAHHEKLDGTGYPNRLHAAAIPVEARMMTIADIFDALTAHDRPYKRAVPVSLALDIIGDEVKRGKCDAELFRVFVEAKTWQHVIPG